MPADFASTARALALPIDEPHQPTQGHPTSPIWRRRSRSSHSVHSSHQASLTNRLLHTLSKLQRQASRTYKKLTPLQRGAIAAAGITALVLGILFLAFNERIFAWLAPIAQKWRDVRAGWLILWAATFLVSFPPLIGYSSCVTIAGFVYGMPNGLSNGAISTIPTVQWQNFMLATAIASPRLLLHVFVGSRLGALAESGGKMDAKTKAISYISIIIGLVAGTATSWFMYTRMQARAAELEAEERGAAIRSGAVAEEDDAFATEYEDDPAEREAVEELRHDDDISLHRHVADEDYQDEFSDEEDAQDTSGDVDGHEEGDSQKAWRK
ncbi:Tlg2-vesicle protein [Elasticomyces elasticus]|nr:Tlg2-vesicle protein [Elasticomyces elasticus]